MTHIQPTPRGGDNAEDAKLKDDLRKLFEYVQRIKLEVAAVKHPKSNVDHFEKVADQLAAIVDATEDATNSIMEATEVINSEMDEMARMVRYPEAQAQHARIGDAINRVFEACSFQDITGQRITKIVTLLSMIEGTINSLVGIIGVDDVTPRDVGDVDAVKVDNGVALHGPSEGVSQADIDKLFD